MLNSKNQFQGKTAIITGGSKGIGKAAAKEFVKYGGSVCIIARKKTDLTNAVHEISNLRIEKGQRIDAIACDATDMKLLNNQLARYIKKNGVPDYLMNFVGYSYPNYVQDLTFEDFKKNIETNYYGQLVPILALLPYFMERKKGYIVNCSSVVGYMGLIGFAAYAPTKFAICGLTESLRNELKAYNIRFSILYPPDTDTPGFAHENRTKPVEVKIMSQGGGFLSPEQVAGALMRGIAKNKFYILPGQAKLLWRITRHFPNLSHIIMDRELKKAAIKAKRGSRKGAKPLNRSKK
jgi:3-dehydrosphinganine reductase